MFEDRSGQSASGLTRFLAGLSGLGLSLLLGACANVSDPQTPQPQPDPSAATSPATDAASAAAQAASTPVKRTVTKTTYVRVRRGDSLQRIAAAHNVSVRDLTAWNHLKPNGRLRAGQSLKLVSTQTIIVQQAAPAQGGAAAVANTAQSRAVAAEVARHADSVALMWPARGHVVEPFEPGTTRGIEIGGKAGDPVLAAADGKVMYAGTGLNGYGSLIIVQHNKDFLTAYSHNRRLLVKTGDTVHQGQQIAEMGNENNDRVAVLFEVRRDGKPVDPMPYLPTPQS
ncbi:lipoprotein NlpD [Paraburkholderia bannensis]|uniref:Lipoprotein NlpD n=1 Tax=Paraburkholderia bannensis TaxID=765414 RepID=A0A7W9U222_9BURK|nr:MULTISPECIES: peptidoglycan DD-metalloendopeptidase family protein [Paraburkholderia]MBB3260552.1 lipoprotein NlpD [Paraburkholderia sp. WP4_3_2]MBB6105588.1 lipoprotein NlpD [Paraburkholderia bannensis]